MSVLGKVERMVSAGEGGLHAWAVCFVNTWRVIPAVRVESTGIAPTWEHWFALLDGSPFDRDCAAVVLIGASDHYYSRGMHHFGLPESEPRFRLALEPDLHHAADHPFFNPHGVWRLTAAHRADR